MNYRSAVVFGTARLVTGDAERLHGLRVITENLVPGRWAAVRPPTRKEMAATAVLAVPLAEASVKVRSGPPGDDPDDYALDVWAGVVPAALTFGPAEPDPDLPPGTPVPAHIQALACALGIRAPGRDCRPGGDVDRKHRRGSSLGG